MVIDLQQAKLDPSSVFKQPYDVLNEPSLSRAEKIDILQRWAYDARELAVAEEENMIGPDSNHEEILHEISKCLLKLGQTSDDLNSPPTKQG